MREVSGHIVLLRSKRLDGCLQLQVRAANHEGSTLQFRTSLLFVKPNVCNSPVLQMNKQQISSGFMDPAFKR